MLPLKMSPEERDAALDRFLEKYKKRGFTCVSRTATSAELHKPARFPRWLFPEQNRIVVIDEDGSIYVEKVRY